MVRRRGVVMRVCPVGWYDVNLLRLLTSWYGSLRGTKDEAQQWAQAVEALSELLELRNSAGPRETLAKVNSSIAGFPSEQQLETDSGYEQLTEQNFIQGLEELLDGARKEVK